MSYLLNVSFVFDEKIEQQFVLWFKNNPILDNLLRYRMIGSNEGSITYCAQATLKTVTEVQKMTSDLHAKLHDTLKKDFNEEIIFYMSALESL